MGMPTKALQNLYFRGKYAMIKDFKLKILICSISAITEHAISSPITLLNWEIFAALEALGGYKLFFRFRSRGTMCQYLASFEFLSVCSPAYLPYLSPNFGSLSGQAMKRNHTFKKAKTSNKKKSVCLWQNVWHWEEYPCTSFRMYGFLRLVLLNWI